MAKLDNILAYANSLLEIHEYKDYCPNGLQVEGKTQVNKIITGVTACMALLDVAVEKQADIVLVHHGYFWKGENPIVVGMKKNRLQLLLQNNINLVAYHLPLDDHASLGNNMQLAKRLNWNYQGKQELVCYGELNQVSTGEELALQLQQGLGQEPLYIAANDKTIKRIAWCTGAAQNFINNAVALDVDAYISGEISEPTVHIARELNIHYFAAGHHATERYGIQALGQHLAKQFGLEHEFVDIANPV